MVRKREGMDLIASIIAQRSMPMSKADICRYLEITGESVHTRALDRWLKALVSEGEQARREQHGYPVIERMDRAQHYKYQKRQIAQASMTASGLHPQLSALLQPFPENIRGALATKANKLPSNDARSCEIALFKKRYRTSGVDPLRPRRPEVKSDIRLAVVGSLTEARPWPHKAEVRTVDGHSELSVVPLGMVVSRHGIEELIAGVARKDRIESIPLHLIQAYEPITMTGARHDDIDLDTALYKAQDVNRDPEEFVLHVTREVAEELLRSPIGLTELEPEPLEGDRFAFRVLIRDSREFRWWVASKSEGCKIFKEG